MAPTISSESILRNVLQNTSHGVFGKVDVVENDKPLSAVTSTLRSLIASTVKYTSIEENAAQNCSDTSSSVLSDPSDEDTHKGVQVLGEIPTKEIIIVLLMLALWLYSIMLTKKAWYRILKE